MSNISRIQANNATIDGCIAKANALPDAGSDSGRASIDTCTVSVRADDIYVRGSTVTYTTYENGKIVSKHIQPDAEVVRFDYTLSNVVCGSSIYVDAYAPFSLAASTVNAVAVARLRLGGTSVFEITASNGGMAAVEMYDEDA